MFQTLSIFPPSSPSSLLPSCRMCLLLPHHPSSYSASKAATRAMTDCLRLELKTTNNDHIRVSTICPQFVSTGMFKGCCSNEYDFVIFFYKIGFLDIVFEICFSQRILLMRLLMRLYMLLRMNVMKLCYLYCVKKEYEI